MSKYRIASVEPQASGNVHCDTYVLIEEDDGEGGTVDRVAGHFTVVLNADAVLALAGLDKPARIAGYKALFFADSRIQRTTDSVEAAAQMSADVPFPVTVSF